MLRGSWIKPTGWNRRRLAFDDVPGKVASLRTTLARTCSTWHHTWTDCEAIGTSRGSCHVRLLHKPSDRGGGGGERETAQGTSGQGLVGDERDLRIDGGQRCPLVVLGVRGMWGVQVLAELILAFLLPLGLTSQRTHVFMVSHSTLLSGLTCRSPGQLRARRR